MSHLLVAVNTRSYTTRLLLTELHFLSPGFNSWKYYNDLKNGGGVFDVTGDDWSSALPPGMVPRCVWYVREMPAGVENHDASNTVELNVDLLRCFRPHTRRNGRKVNGGDVQD